MAKKDRGHVKTFSISTTEALILRGYSEDAHENTIEAEEGIEISDVGEGRNNKPQAEPEIKNPQIEKPSPFIYKSGGMRI